MIPVLDVAGLAYAYPDGHQALYGVDLHVHQGERVALLGPNGAGKTTLVLHLNGILVAGAGTVSVSGLPVTKANLPEVRRRVGVVFQDPDDQLFMATVRDDVAFGPANLGLRGEALERRVRDALDRVGMADFVDRPPHHLSFGQRRRVAVATVLAMEPEILVLDEPSSNLDPASRRELAEILTSLDVTVLMVTHDLPYALELCPRSVILSDGVIVADGATYDVLTDDALMSAHRLELPFGFDPRTIRTRRRRVTFGSTPPSPAQAGSDPRRTTVAPSDAKPEHARERDRGDPRAAGRHHRPARLPGQPQDDRPARDQRPQGALRGRAGQPAHRQHPQGRRRRRRASSCSSS